MEATHGAGRGDQAVARRLGIAGACRDRRARGRRRDARAGVRHRRDRGARQDAAGRLAEEAAAQQHAVTRRRWRSSSARATRRGSRTGTTWSGPTFRSSPPTRRRRAARAGTTSAAWGYALRKNKRERGGGARLRRRGSTRTCRCSTPAPAAQRRRSSSAASATYSSRGRTKRSSAVKQLGPDKFDIVVPSVSIRAEPPVAVNDAVAQKHGTTKVARAYLEFLYTDAAQALGAKHYFRPTGPRSLAKYGGAFLKVQQFYDRRGVRRLEQGAADALRRRRRVRPDLFGGAGDEPLTVRAPSDAVRAARAVRVARGEAHPGLHARLSAACS